MSKREATLYWVKRKDAKDILIFDIGQKDGTLYIYEFKDSVLVNDVQKTTNDIKLWIEKKFGFPTSAWKLESAW